MYLSSPTRLPQLTLQALVASIVGLEPLREGQLRTLWHAFNAKS